METGARHAAADRARIVLGGGGMLGATQVGMLRALLESGFAPGLIVGTGVGALNGAAIAAEPTLAGVETLTEIGDHRRRPALRKGAAEYRRVRLQQRQELLQALLDVCHDRHLGRQPSLQRGQQRTRQPGGAAERAGDAQAQRSAELGASCSTGAAGFEASRESRACKEPGLAVVVLTGISGEQLGHEAVAAGAQDS